MQQVSLQHRSGATRIGGQTFRPGGGCTQRTEIWSTTADAGVDVTQEAWCSHTQTDLIPSPPPMEGLGKAGRLPSAAAGVKRLQQCWGCQSIGIILVSVVRSTHGISTDDSGVDSVS